MLTGSGVASSPFPSFPAPFPASVPLECNVRLLLPVGVGLDSGLDNYGNAKYGFKNKYFQNTN